MDVVGPVAVGAGRDPREAEVGHLAVVGVPERLLGLGMAVSALLDDLQAPGLDVRLPDVVRRVAVGADGGPACRRCAGAFRGFPPAYSRSMPWWHEPQVAGMLSRKILEVGSEERRMSCMPWHVLQLGAVTRPLFKTARP